MGNNSDPVTLHKYLYGNVDPVNMVDPTGNFSIGSLNAASKIRGILSETQVEVGFSVFDSIATGENQAGRNAAIGLGLAVIGGPAAFKLLGMLSKKFKNKKNSSGKPQCFDNSFVEGTVVHTKEGLKNIEDIIIGDEVLSFDEVSGERSYQQVTHLIRGKKYESVVITLENGEVIESTLQHTFHVIDDWIEAENLKPGYPLSLVKGVGSVLSIRQMEINEKVYNLTVDNNHNYYITEKGVLVHNTGGCKRIKEVSINAGSFEGARNKALTLLGEIDPATRKKVIGRLPASKANGKVVGFETNVNGIWKQYRLDYDPKKGPHINVKVGKGQAMIINHAVEFPGTEADFLKLLKGLN